LFRPCKWANQDSTIFSNIVFVSKTFRVWSALCLSVILSKSSSKMASYSDWNMPEPIQHLEQTGPLVMGPGARKGDSAFVGPLPKLSIEETVAVQLAKKYAMEQSIKMVKLIRTKFFLFLSITIVHWMHIEEVQVIRVACSSASTELNHWHDKFLSTVSYFSLLGDSFFSWAMKQWLISTEMTFLWFFRSWSDRRLLISSIKQSRFNVTRFALKSRLFLICFKWLLPFTKQGT